MGHATSVWEGYSDCSSRAKVNYLLCSWKLDRHIFMSVIEMSFLPLSFSLSLPSSPPSPSFLSFLKGKLRCMSTHSSWKMAGVTLSAQPVFKVIHTFQCAIPQSTSSLKVQVGMTMSISAHDASTKESSSLGCLLGKNQDPKVKAMRPERGSCLPCI